MKHLKIAALLLVATATVSAQDLKLNEVPAKVQSTFTKAYNTASDVEWEKEADHFKVEFDKNKMEHEIWYDANGTVVKSEMEISEKDLPAVIASAVNSKYADYKIDSVEVTEEGTSKTYEIEIEKGWIKERTLIIDASGKIVSDLED